MSDIKVLQEYPGPGKEGEQDIFFILRPQANNCYFEALLLSLFRKLPDYKKNFWCVYLANMPGAIIQAKKLMERHYEYRLFFSQYGSKVMTDRMKYRFQKYFSTPFDTSEIVGSFTALERLGLTPQELFNLHTKKEDTVNVEGQSIRRYYDANGKPVYVINYDIPALMTFNHEGTNSAIFVLRTTYTYKQLNRVILRILNTITQEIANSTSSIAKKVRTFLSEEDVQRLLDKDFYRHKRLFHYSHGPFEQILDAREFLYVNAEERVPIEDYTFVTYLMQRGVDEKMLRELIRNPIITVDERAYAVEDSLYVYTRNMSYEKAFLVINKIIAQKLTKLQNLVS